MLKTLATAMIVVASAMPAFAQIADHPTGFWVVQGSDCDGKDRLGFGITDTTLTMFDPSRTRYQFSSEGVSKTSDLSAEVNTLTKAEATDEGVAFFDTSQITGRDIQITLLTDTGDGSKVRVETGTFPMTPCKAT